MLIVQKQSDCVGWFTGEMPIEQPIDAKIFFFGFIKAGSKKFQIWNTFQLNSLRISIG